MIEPDQSAIRPAETDTVPARRRKGIIFVAVARQLRLPHGHQRPDDRDRKSVV